MSGVDRYLKDDPLGNIDGNIRVNFSSLHKPKAKRKPFAKHFLKKWLDEPMFEKWLAEIPNFPSKGYCKVCETELLAGHSELEKHAAGRRHCIRMREEFGASPVKQTADNSVVIVAREDPELDFLQYRLANDEYTETAKNREAPDTAKPMCNSQKTVEARTRPPAFIVRSSNPTKASSLASDKVVIKRKSATTRTDAPIKIAKAAIPEQTVRLLKILRSDSEDDEMEELEDGQFPDDEATTTEYPEQLMRELRAEINFAERQLIDEKRNADKVDTSTVLINDRMNAVDAACQQIAERELEARLCLIQEKRRYQLNLYKLQLIEMQTRVRLAQEETRRSEELHQFRLAQLQLQIQRENETVVQDSTEASSEIGL